MKYKLYKAIDGTNAELASFLLRCDGMVAVSGLSRGSANQARISKVNADLYEYSPARRFNDAVNPTLIAEWED